MTKQELNVVIEEQVLNLLEELASKSKSEAMTYRDKFASDESNANYLQYKINERLFQVFQKIRSEEIDIIDRLKHN